MKAAGLAMKSTYLKLLSNETKERKKDLIKMCYRRQLRQRSRPTCKGCLWATPTLERPTRRDISGTPLSFILMIVIIMLTCFSAWWKFYILVETFDETFHDEVSGCCSGDVEVENIVVPMMFVAAHKACNWSLTFGWLTGPWAEGRAFYLGGWRLYSFYMMPLPIGCYRIVFWVWGKNTTA